MNERLKLLHIQPIESLLGKSNRKRWHGTDTELQKWKSRRKVTVAYQVGNMGIAINSEGIYFYSGGIRYDCRSRERLS
jgi:hypothetical protein